MIIGVRFGVALALSVIAIAVLFYRYLRRRDVGLPLGYIGVRVLEGATLLVAGLLGLYAKRSVVVGGEGGPDEGDAGGGGFGRAQRGGSSRGPRGWRGPRCTDGGFCSHSCDKLAFVGR